MKDGICVKLPTNLPLVSRLWIRAPAQSWLSLQPGSAGFAMMKLYVKTLV